MKKVYLSVLLTLIVSFFAFAQSPVTGKITDKSGTPLPGVSVVIQGTTNATVTDENGEFSIDVPSGAEGEKKKKLIISFIGMKTLVLDQDADFSNLVLTEDTKIMDEVIVSGMAIEKDKTRIGYAAQNVSGEELQRSFETNVVNALNGKVAGVQIISSAGTPGASSTIRVRGTNTLGTNFQPLFVVDGIPIDNSETASSQERDANVPFTQGVNNSNRAVDLASDDIESITVLKGPAATALYGIRAANGAVIVTTKRGKFGMAKPEFSFNLGYSIDQVNKLPEFQTKYSQGINGRYFDPATNQAASWGALIDTLRYAPNTTNLFTGRNIVGVSQAPDGERVTPFENPKNFFVLGSTRNIGFSAAGGTNISNFRFSLSNTSQNGVVPLSTFDRTSLKFVSSFKLTDKLILTGQANYINSGGTRMQQGSNLSGLMLGLFRTPPTFDNSGGFDRPWENEAAFLLPNGRQRAYRGNGTYDNPFFSVARNQTKDDVNRIIAFGEAKYTFNENLFATFRLGIDFYSDVRRGGFDRFAAAFPAGRTFEDRISNSDITSDLIVTYTKKFGDFDVIANVGHNFFDSQFGRTYAQGDGLTARDFQSLSNASSYLSYQSNAWIRRYGVYADVNFGYKSRYYLNVTGRNDWTSTLAKENNSFFYPSVGLSYLLTEDLKDLGVIQDESILSFAKLKASWAQVGRDAPAYSTYTIYGQPLVGDGYTNGIPLPYAGINGLQSGTSGGSSQPVLGNPNLKPEQNTTSEVGAEMAFLNKRVGFDFTYYQTLNKNLIVNAQIASSSGYQYQLVNTGEIETKGIELVVNAVPIKTGDFTWETAFNYTRYRNKVLALGPGLDNLFRNGFTGSGSFAIPGQPFGVFYGNAYLKHDGKYLVDPDGFYIIDPEARVLGDPNPDWLGGWRNTFSYKGFYLTALLDIRVGGDVWNGTRGALEFFGTHKNTEDRSQPTKILEGIQADYDGTLITDANGSTIDNDIEISTQDYWRFAKSSFGGANDFSMEKVNWVRLRDVSIGYSFPKSLVSKIKLSGLDVSLFARNALLITNYTGIDPETNLTGSSSGSGLDYFNMPNTRSFGGNLRVTF